MAIAAKLNSRYEQLEVLGEGGMGVVYRAYDSFLRREVTLKTVRDIQDQTALELFKREVNVLAGMSHPNIVEIFDVGEISEAGGKRPYFVMPLLRGVTLDKLIKSSSQRLTIGRCVDIMSQVCRGLQAAHDAGLVHRDLKPSNLFILEDDSVKIIDFGVAHLVDAHSTAGMKGTLLYMAPEQILLKRPSPLSDVFAAAVVCFFAVTRRHPFEGVSREEIADAIVNRMPAPASDFNPAVGPALSQVIHKAMAKQPFQRFGSAREFSENLQKALRNEPIECFDPVKIEARVHRAQKAFDESQFGIASDILAELEAEASLHPDIAPLRKRIESADKQRTITQLLDTARRCLDGQEYQLALQKVQEVLNLDSTNTEARSLQGEIENKKSTEQIEDWYRIAAQHLENHSYAHARDALQNVLKLKPKEASAQSRLAEVDRQEQEYIRLRQEKERFYQAALQAMHLGELSSALTKLERVLEMDRRAPDTFAPDRAAMYQKLYNDVRSQHDVLDRGYAETRRYVETGNFPAALALCAEFLTKYPEHAMFRSLRLDAEDRQRQEISAYVARVSHEVEAEPDLGRRIVMLEEALEKHPDEPHFARSLQNNRTKRDLVEGIVLKARTYEGAGQYSEALDQWRILRDIYPQYPGLEVESERVQKRKEQKERSEAKGRWVEQIDRRVNLGEFSRALDLCAAALAEFPNDSELIALERTSQQGLQRMRDSQRLLEEAREEFKQHNKPRALELLREALQIESSNASVRTALIDALIADAREKLDHDWKAAEAPVQEVLELDPGNARAKSLRTLISDKQQEEYIANALSRARELGATEAALAVLDEALEVYPKNPPLVHRRAGIEHSMEAARRQQTHKHDLTRVQQLASKAERESDLLTLRSIFEETQAVANRYPEDKSFKTLVYEVKTKLEAREKPTAPLAVPANTSDSSRPQKQIEWPKIGFPVRKKIAALGTMIVPSAKKQLEAASEFSQNFWQMVRPHAQSLGSQKTRVKQIAGVSAGIFVALLLLAVYSVIKDRQGTQKSREVQQASVGRLDVQVQPHNAAVEVYDKDRKMVTDLGQLPFGEYVISVSATGYQPEERKMDFRASSQVEITLRPLSQAFELVTEVNGLTATLDGEPLKPSASGQFTANDLSDDQHTIVLGTPTGSRATLTFLSKKGALPEVVSFTADSMTRAVAVSSFGGDAKMLKPAGAKERVSASWDSDPAEEISDTGVIRSGIALKEHVLSLAYGNDRREHSIKVDSSPKLAVFVSDQNLGTLVIDVGYQDVLVEANGKLLQLRKAQRNRLVGGLEPKEYALRLTKEGFHPEVQKLTIRRGETQTVKVALREVAKHGTLVVKRGKGFDISIGDSPWYRMENDSESPLNSPLGRQRVRVQKDGYRPWEETREFQPDRPELLDVGEIKLQPLEAVITFKVSPPETRVRLVGSDGKDVAITGRSVTVREGKYVASGSAPDYEPANDIPFEVTGGRNKEIEIVLKRKPVSAPKAPVVTQSPMDGWKPDEWKLGEGNWYNATRSGPLLFTGRRSTFTFVALLNKKRWGGEKFSVLVDYKNNKDYIEFEIQQDKVTLIRREGGKKFEEQSKRHTVGFDTAVNVMVRFTGDEVTINLGNGAAYTQLSSYKGTITGQFGLSGVKAIAYFKAQ